MMRGMRLVAASAVAVVVATLLLGAGWLRATLREREAQLSEARGQLAQRADLVRAAVDESLAELRTREDPRPFYLYNHYYSPPDVLALSDPVARSPLAQPPRDRRLVGYFQVGPDGLVQTPYQPDSERPSPRAERIAAALSRPDFAGLRRMAAGGQSPLDPDSGARTPLLGLDAWSRQQASEIVAAQGGDSVANDRLLQRGRRVPRIHRRNADWPAGTAPPSGVGSGLDNLVQRQAEVSYTPMTYLDTSDQLVLHRRVTHEQTTVVQGVLLDRRELVERWIPELIARHAGGGALTVHTPISASPSESAADRCLIRRPASSVLEGVELCVAAGVLGPMAARLDAELWMQVGGLGALWFLVVLAASAIVLATRRAERLSRQKSDFVSAVSHELRTPLTTLRMHAEMLEEGLVSDVRRPKVHRELVHESVRLARLVENVLSLSKLEDGRSPIRRLDGDLSALVRDVGEQQRSRVEAKGFALRLEVPGASPARFDPQAVEQILINLIDNALKYGGGAQPEILITLEREGGPPVLIVADRGPGIPETERERVFERFHRVECPEHAHAPGTGIGLALVAELARAHGGHASAHPREGGGLTLRVQLAP